jgi:hypothetical protein
MIKFLWRLSVILLIPSIIIVLIIIRPLRWLFTGNYYPKQVKNTFIYKWNKKSGFNMN